MFVFEGQAKFGGVKTHGKGARLDPHGLDRGAQSQCVPISSLVEVGVGGDMGLIQRTTAPKFEDP